MREYVLYNRLVPNRRQVIIQANDGSVYYESLGLDGLCVVFFM